MRAGCSGRSKPVCEWERDAASHMNGLVWKGGWIESSWHSMPISFVSFPMPYSFVPRRDLLHDWQLWEGDLVLCDGTKNGFHQLLLLSFALCLHGRRIRIGLMWKGTVFPPNHWHMLFSSNGCLHTQPMFVSQPKKVPHKEVLPDVWIQFCMFLYVLSISWLFLDLCLYCYFCLLCFLNSFMVQSTCLLVVCLSECGCAAVCERAQSSLDYCDCEEEVSSPPGTPAWLAAQMIQARV